MPKRALVDHRPWLLASIAAAVAYYFLRDNQIGGLWLILLKGSCVALLGLYAARRSYGNHSLLIAAVMFLSALGDMAIELSFEAGGAFFFVAHAAAIALYLQYKRHHTVMSQQALAIVLLIGTPAISWMLSGSWAVSLYALALGAMAATAWTSRFPRYRVGTGAVLFVVSDLLIFSRMGPIDLGSAPDAAIWPLYYTGQFLIATGVVQTLRHELAEEGD